MDERKDCIDSTVRSNTELPRHPIYWFQDGSLILEAQDVQYRVHRSLLQRHSVYLASVDLGEPSVLANDFTNHILSIPRESGWRDDSKDIEALLEHMYHDFPLSLNSPFERVAAVLRSSSPQQFDMPVLHAQAKEYLSSFFSRKSPSDIEVNIIPEALVLGRNYQLQSVVHVALYRAMVASNLEQDDETTTSSTNPRLQATAESVPAVLDSSPSQNTHQLTANDMNLCKRLMMKIIDHFTPVLFTPATTPHMACTDVFADTWMSLVISPAIEDGGVYKPIETLERMKGLDWSKCGLCSACVVEKREEWMEEQQTVWTIISNLLEEEA